MSTFDLTVTPVMLLRFLNNQTIWYKPIDQLILIIVKQSGVSCVLNISLYVAVVHRSGLGRRLLSVANDDLSTGAVVVLVSHGLYGRTYRMLPRVRRQRY